MSETVYTVDASDMPDYDGMEYEELLSACQYQWLRAEHAEGKLKATEKRRGELEDELAATERELKMARGQLSTTLNNWEQAKGKIRREKAVLEERRKELAAIAAQTADERVQARIDKLTAKLEEAEREREEWRAKCGRMLDLADEIKGLR